MYHLYKNTKIHYEQIGEGIPVVIIHGTSVDYRLMAGCLEPVFSAKPGFERIYLDIPGMGHSVPGAEIRSDSDIIDAFMDTVHACIGSEHFLVIGESYGSYLVRGIIDSYKTVVDGAAFICPWIPDIPQTLPERCVIDTDESFLQTLSAAELSAFSLLSVCQTSDAYQRFAADIMPSFSLFNGDFWKTVKRNLCFNQSETFIRPALFITARQDNAAGYDAAFILQRIYPRATFAVMDGAGHNAQIERVTLFNALVADWLDRVLACI